MKQLSIVIITKNEAKNIAACIQSARQLTNDIIVVDAMSEDDTATIAAGEGARVYSLMWKGYGFARNYGAAKAAHPWIFSFDADERIDAGLVKAIKDESFHDKSTVYYFRRKNFIAGKETRFGTLGFETVKRIYHRDHQSWDLSLVHERLQPLKKKKKLPGAVLHFGLHSLKEYNARAQFYADLSARKYLQEGRTSTAVKSLLSSVFNSIKSYFFQLGFLDGYHGFYSAKTIANYSWKKYRLLRKMEKSEQLNDSAEEKSLQSEAFPVLPVRVSEAS